MDVPNSLLKDVERIRALEAAPTQPVTTPKRLHRSAYTGPPFTVACECCSIRWTLDYLPNFCLWCRARWK